ncbi:MAG: hypothetical protein Fur0020_07550 [Thermodesulfovibrionia bacterium]
MVFNLVCIISFLIPIAAEAGITFYDDIVLKGMPYLLKAETRKGPFKMGGRMVEFIVDDKSIGNNLSGGDGIALKEFIPERKGIYRVTVRADGDEDSGYILSLNRGEGVVVIDIEGGIFEGPFPLRERQGSKDAIKGISMRYPILYLHTLMDREGIERLLREKGFAPAPILNWDDGDAINRIYDIGVRIKALIGSPLVIEAIKDEGVKAFSFEETEGAEWVKDWKEIERRLR